jgi:hypothetical protein
MDMGTAMVIVAGIGAWYSLKAKGVHIGRPLRQRHAGGEPQSETAPVATSTRESELQREVEQLRERIHVLERIATDSRKPHALAAEIESLRDR